MKPRGCTGRSAGLWGGTCALALSTVVNLWSCSLLAPSDGELRAGAVSGDASVNLDASGSGRDGAVDGSAGDGEAVDSSDGSSPPSPISTTKLALWLMADQGVIHNSTAVREWQDQSGNGLHARQSVKDSYPHLWPSGIAGKPALDFDGTLDFLVLPEGFADFTAGVSLFAIAQTGSLESCASVVELSNGSEADDIALGRTGAAVGYEVYDTYIDQGLPAIPVDTPVLLSATHPTNGAARTFLNGLYSGQKTIALPVNEPRTSNLVGLSQYEVCKHWIGRIGEIIIYNRYLDDAERKQVEGYLQQKWGCCR